MEMYVFDFVMPSAQKMSCIFMVVQTNEKKVNLSLNNSRESRRVLTTTTIYYESYCVMLSVNRLCMHEFD